jgi:hypothetical protein
MFLSSRTMFTGRIVCSALPSSTFTSGHPGFGPVTRELARVQSFRSGSVLDLDPDPGRQKKLPYPFKKEKRKNLCGLKSWTFFHESLWPVVELGYFSGGVERFFNEEAVQVLGHQKLLSGDPRHTYAVQQDRYR